MAAMTSSCAALRPAGVRVSAPRQARSRVVVAVAKTEVSLRATFLTQRLNHRKWKMLCHTGAFKA